MPLRDPALEAFAGLMLGGTLFPAALPVAVQLRIPLWDAALLEADALALLSRFPPALQYGDHHGGAWRTLSLRSAGGALDDDSPAPLGSYAATPAWAASTYIVPCVLRALTASLPLSCDGSVRGCGPFQRVRLSVIPPGCNVAWHTDYEDTRVAGPARLHIPLLCSAAFSMDIAGRPVSMAAGESWLGQFELPHRLRNGSSAESVLRIHLIVDLWPTTPAVAPAGGCGCGDTRHDSVCSASFAPPSSPADWSELRRTDFGAALETAHCVLYEGAGLPAAVVACAGAFETYRWAVPCTTAERAAVEATWYGDAAQAAAGK